MRVARTKLLCILQASAHWGVVIGLAGVGVMAVVCLLLGGLPPLRLLAMAFCVTSSSYAVDRIVDLRRDAHHVSRIQALQRTHVLAAASFGLFGVAVALGLTSEHPVTGVLTLVFPLSVALYVVPWMGRFSERLQRAGIRRIKDIPFAKAFYVPTCWSLMVFWAAPFFPAARGREIALAVCFMYPSLFVTAAACDLRDEQADRAAGITTFPVVLGRAKTIAMLRAVHAGSIALCCLLSVLEFAPALSGLLALSGWPLSWCLARIAAGEGDIVFFADVVFDLLWVVQPLPALAATAALTGCP